MSFLQCTCVFGKLSFVASGFLLQLFEKRADLVYWVMFQLSLSWVRCLPEKYHLISHFRLVIRLGLFKQGSQHFEQISSIFMGRKVHLNISN